METYCEPKELVENPDFRSQRALTLGCLSEEMIDKPIVGLMNRLNDKECFFTLQCCYGHFLFDGRRDPENLEPLPESDAIKEVEYRIAYIAFCIENSTPGKKLLALLRNSVSIDPDNIQFCSADWFWDRQVNSFALQVEPDRFKARDKAQIGYREALKVEAVRNRFFHHLEQSLSDLA